MEIARLDFTGKELPQDCCPYCGYAVNCAAEYSFDSTAHPKVGDATVCIKCSGLSVFGEGMRLYIPSGTELSLFMAMPAVLEAMKNARKIREENKG